MASKHFVYIVQDLTLSLMASCDGSNVSGNTVSVVYLLTFLCIIDQLSFRVYNFTLKYNG